MRLIVPALAGGFLGTLVMTTMLRAASENIANATIPLTTLSRIVPMTLRVTSRVTSL